MNFELYSMHSLFPCLLFSKVLPEIMQGRADRTRQRIAAKVVPATIPCRSRRMVDSWKPGRPFAFRGNSINGLGGGFQMKGLHRPSLAGRRAVYFLFAWHWAIFRYYSLSLACQTESRATSPGQKSDGGAKILADFFLTDCCAPCFFGRNIFAVPVGGFLQWRKLVK